jgi:diadenosine tetraphosphate (Ap4A) HIT family hydrolase
VACELCDGVGGELVWQDSKCRVVRVGDPDYPGFCRVVWQEHVKEMTDLAAPDRLHLMRVVFGVEAGLRELLCPHKVNLASLGNMTPHLHWHVIPRFRGDRHFPGPIWGAPASGAHGVTQAGGSEFTQNLRQALSQDVAHADGSDSV